MLRRRLIRVPDLGVSVWVTYDDSAPAGRDALGDILPVVGVEVVHDREVSRDEAELSLSVSGKQQEDVQVGREFSYAPGARPTTYQIGLKSQRVTKPRSLADLVLLDTQVAVGSQASITSDSVSVTVGDWVVVFLGVRYSTALTSCTFSSSFSTDGWTTYESALMDATTNDARIFMGAARVSSSGSGTVTATPDANGLRWTLAVNATSGQHTTPFRQTANGAGTSGTASTISAPAALQSTSMAVSACIIEGNAGFNAPDAGWNDLADFSSGGSSDIRMNVIWDRTSPPQDWGAHNWPTSSPHGSVGGEVEEASSGATVSPAAVVMTLVVAAPTVTRGTVTISPSAVVATLVVPAPSVTRGTVTLAPSPVVMTLSVPQPTLTQGGVLTPAPVVLTLALPAPSVARGPVTLSPSPVVATLAVPAPTVARGALTVSPTPVSLTLAVPAPSVTRGAVALSPSPVVARLVVPAPAVLRSALAPQPVVMTLFVPAPTVLEVVLIQIMVELELQLARVFEHDLTLARSLTFDLEI